ncbi:THSD7A [Cordylochernes scorpioides]|uniref:THSD7A n=1 Tax=Cordylochernes scorpioides TaxID=51811 RepID=A0ABY6K374_9ARAC|nr:THSD7A [Cordylochernes scorpioides]
MVSCAPRLPGGELVAVEPLCLGPSGQVPDTHCGSLAKPPTQQPCEIKWPGDCVESPWSDWGPCEDGVQKRSRHILRRAERREKPCGAVEERRTWCEVQQYEWQVGAWGSCILPSPLAHCGPGHRRRPLSCTEKSTGLAINQTLCDPLEGAQCGAGIRRREVSCYRDPERTAAPLSNCTSNITDLPSYRDLDPAWIAILLNVQTIEECHIPCPMEPQLPPWSEWSPCYRTDCTNQICTQIVTEIIKNFPHQNIPSDLTIQLGAEGLDTFGGLRPEKYRTRIGPHPGSQWESKPCLEWPCRSYSWIPESQCLLLDGPFKSRKEACKARRASTTMCRNTCKTRSAEQNFKCFKHKSNVCKSAVRR